VAGDWAVYRVRRVYHSKGKAQRCVERLCECESEEEALRVLNQIAVRDGLQVRTLHGISYAYSRERSKTYPTTEEYLVSALALVDPKARHGIDHFNARWADLQDLYCGRDDLPLFPES